MKEKIIPIVSIIIGIIAFFLSQQYLGSEKAKLLKQKAAFEKSMSKTEVLAARKDIARGTKLSMDDVGKIEIAAANRKDSNIDINDAKLIFGKKTDYAIQKGQAILWSDIEGGAVTDQQLSGIINEKMRAISLNINGANAVSCLVMPNDRVDVLGTFTMPVKTNPNEMETVTLTILQNVTVLATGQTLANQKVYAAGRNRQQQSGYNTITLQVTPREAELLIFAQQMKGGLAVVLRNKQDQSYEAALPEINFQYLVSKIAELNDIRQKELKDKR